MQSPEHIDVNALDLRILGRMVYDHAKELNHRVTLELIEPISQWLDDPDWCSRYDIDETVYNWAAYKRQQRRMSDLQRHLQSERMKAYHAELRRRRELRQRISHLLSAGPGSGGSPTQTPQDRPGAFSSLLAPFSPQAHQHRELAREFAKLTERYPEHLIPWRAILLSQGETKTFEDLPRFTESRLAKTTQFLHLLHLSNEGKVDLEQEEHFESITVTPTHDEHEVPVSVTTQNGQTHHIDWRGLSDDQRNKVIADSLRHRIICKS